MKNKNSIKSVLLSIIVLGFIFGSIISFIPELESIKTMPKLQMTIVNNIFLK